MSAIEWAAFVVLAVFVIVLVVALFFDPLSLPDWSHDHPTRDTDVREG